MLGSLTGMVSASAEEFICEDSLGQADTKEDNAENFGSGELDSDIFFGNPDLEEGDSDAFSSGEDDFSHTDAESEDLIIAPAEELEDGTGDSGDELIEISETEFPDMQFQNYVKTTFDADHNDWLDHDEIISATDMNVSDKEIKDLSGIEYFSNLIRLDCSTMEYEYIPFDPQGYKLVLIDSVTKHELVDSPYNKRRLSCVRAAAAIAGNHPEVKLLGDATLEMLEEAKDKISEEDYMRAEYVIEEIQRVLDVCDALERGDYETVGQKMYETHHGMSKLYEVSCEELDFLNDCAKECGVTGSRVMGGGFGGCTISLVKDELYARFIEKA